jgi:hypothetical protein
MNKYLMHAKLDVKNKINRKYYDFYLFTGPIDAHLKRRSVFR